MTAAVHPFQELGTLLNVAPNKAEALAADMIGEGRLSGRIDQVIGSKRELSGLLQQQCSTALRQTAAVTDSQEQSVGVCYCRVMQEAYRKPSHAVVCAPCAG